MFNIGDFVKWLFDFANGIGYVMNYVIDFSQFNSSWTYQLPVYQLILASGGAVLVGLFILRLTKSLIPVA